MNSYSSYTYLSTTGAGIAIGGTGAIQFAGVFRGSDLAGTVVIKDSATTVLTMSADRNITLHTPVRLAGPVTMTSSAGDHFVVLYRQL